MSMPTKEWRILMFELLDITKEEQDQFLKQARRMLSSYRQLKKSYQLALPQAHTQDYDKVSTSKGSRISHENHELIRYLELGEKVEKIEQAVERVENNDYIKNKYMIPNRLQQWQLADLSGYSTSGYNYKLRVVLFDFAVSYGIVDISQFSFKFN